MKDKISKIKSILKKDGIYNTMKKVYKYIVSKHGIKIMYLYYIVNNKKYNKLIKDILKTDYDRIIIWKSDFGWNVPLFQRPQHISTNLSKQRCLVFYEVTKMTDNVNDIKKISENLYLINLNNKMIQKILYNNLNELDKNKYIQFYSTDYKISLAEIKKYINDGFKIIYEYIDDLSPKIVGTDEIPKNMIEKYNYILKDKENVFVVVTADRLKDDILKNRGSEKLTIATNGVDISHFKEIDEKFKFEKEFNDIMTSHKPLIGYYGALASWMDYELLKFLAISRPDYNIVLFGVKYDESFEKSKIDSISNIYFLGKKNYNILQNYASKFDVCIIPFKLNDITKATSPVKLFEYMALNKPIVTTDLNECRKYKSVMIAKNETEFISLIDKAINLKDNIDSDYYKLLKKESIENTWDKKSSSIVKLLEKYE